MQTEPETEHRSYLTPLRPENSEHVVTRSHVADRAHHRRTRMHTLTTPHAPAHVGRCGAYWIPLLDSPGGAACCELLHPHAPRRRSCPLHRCQHHCWQRPHAARGVLAAPRRCSPAARYARRGLDVLVSMTFGNVGTYDVLRAAAPRRAAAPFAETTSKQNCAVVSLQQSHTCHSYATDLPSFISHRSSHRKPFLASYSRLS